LEFTDDIASASLADFLQLPSHHGIERSHPGLGYVRYFRVALSQQLQGQFRSMFRSKKVQLIAFLESSAENSCKSHKDRVLSRIFHDRFLVYFDFFVYFFGLFRLSGSLANEFPEKKIEK
jgi:hypothetical protein